VRVCIPPCVAKGNRFTLALGLAQSKITRTPIGGAPCHVHCVSLCRVGSAVVVRRVFLSADSALVLDTGRSFRGIYTCCISLSQDWGRANGVNWVGEDKNCCNWQGQHGHEFWSNTSTNSNSMNIDYRSRRIVVTTYWYDWAERELSQTGKTFCFGELDKDGAGVCA